MKEQYLENYDDTQRESLNYNILLAPESDRLDIEQNPKSQFANQEPISMNQSRYSEDSSGNDVIMKDNFERQE